MHMWGVCIIYMPATESAMAMSNEWLGKMKEIDKYLFTENTYKISNQKS